MLEINPYLALSIFVLIALIAVYIFLPKKGLIAKYRKVARDTKRVLIEDALKHMYDYESHSLSSTLNSIAGNLSVSVDKASTIVENLKKLNLVKLDNHSLSLTGEGRQYALRVIRIHRLWENYLAEETGIGEIDWHEEAEEVEHFLSQEDADQLSAKMGNPKYDPHGDPIPDTDGKVLHKKGKLLNSVDIGTIVKVLHVEDEPKTIYLKVLEQGLYPGKEILVLDKYDNKLTIAADGMESTIEALVASKVSVEVLDKKDFKNEKIRTLVDLKPGETAEVINVSPNCRGQQRRRLLDFGIVPGSSISIHMNSPLNDPTAYLVKETIVALRRNQANKVLITN